MKIVTDNNEMLMRIFSKEMKDNRQIIDGYYAFGLICREMAHSGSFPAGLYDYVIDVHRHNIITTIQTFLHTLEKSPNFNRNFS